MKKTLKKLLTIVLAVTMLTGLITVTAFADDGDDADYIPETLGVYVGITDEAVEVPYETSSEAVPAANYVTADGFEYSLNSSNQAIIQGYKGSLTSVTIPAKVNGYTVVEVSNLRGNSITNITVSNGIQRISSFAFYKNPSLKTVSIPKSVTDIDNGVFRNDPNLQSITVDSANTKYKSVDGILFSKDSKTLVCYPAAKPATSYSIPSTVEELDYYAFSYAKNLTSITIPGSVKYVCNRVFEYCTSLTNVVVPEGVTGLPYAVFDHCTSLQSISLPSTLTYVISDFLSYCTCLTTITVSPASEWLTVKDGVLYAMPQSGKLTLMVYPYGKNATFFSVPDSVEINGVTANVEVIGNCSFLSCRYLQTVDLPNSITEIQSNAFRESVVQDITIPKVCTTVESDAFYKANNFTDVYYRGTEAQKSGITIGTYNDPFKNATWHYNCSAAFIDVYTTDWFHDPVMFVKEKGIMTGLGGTNKFGPAQPLQREQFAIILWRLENCPAAAYEAKFPDVPNGTWFTEPIMWAYKKGVITGYASGSFGVGDNITREQFATMIYRYAKNIRGIEMKNYADISTYPDAASVSDWAVEPMRWAVGNGIITGKQGGKYLDPAGNAQRCEGATMIQRFMTKFVPN